MNGVPLEIPSMSSIRRCIDPRSASPRTVTVTAWLNSREWCSST